MSSIEEYKKFVRNLAETRTDRLFLNSENEQSLVVSVELFKSSKNNIKILANSLCSGIECEPEYLIALSEYIEKGGEIYILLNHYDEAKIRESNLFKRLALYLSQSSNAIHIKRTSAKVYYEAKSDKKYLHFTVGDDTAYKIELDSDEIYVETNFNNEKKALFLSNLFDQIYNDERSTTVNILNLFDDGNR